MDNSAEIKNIANAYLRLRKAIGFLGISFPFLLYFGSLATGYCEPLQNTISCYYHTVMRNVFEGVLWTIAIFLMCYKYDKVDDIATNLAGICALGVALCPTHIGDCNTCGVIGNRNDLLGNMHVGFAMSLFLILAFICLFLFTRTNKPKNEMGKPKLRRNFIYKICGWTIVACVICIGIYYKVLNQKPDSLANLRPVFFLESLSLLAFGISWIVKGEFIGQVIQPMKKKITSVVLYTKKKLLGSKPAV